MVESKQNRAHSASTLRKASKSFQECPDVERINVLDLKAHIVKRVGAQRANRYFAHFVCFLSSRLSKPELDKLVVVTIGKENVALHNQLVKAILSNAVKGKVPPPLPPSPLSQHCVKSSSKHQSPSVTSNHTIPHTSPSTLSNGDSFLSSPRSARSTARQSRDRDYRVSPLGHSEAHSAPDLSQPIQALDVAAKQLDAESNSSLEPPAKRACIECLASDDSGGSGLESEVIGGEESIFLKEEREERLPRLSFGIKGSIGLPFRFESGKSGRRPDFCAFPAQFLKQDGLDDGILGVNDLPDGDTMHSLIEQVAVGEGLEGASRECADILNLALDAYLMRLIKSCGAVAGERAGMVQECTSQGSSVWDKRKNGGAMKLGGTNGVRMGPPVEPVKKDTQNAQPLVSLMDFKVAMDMNPCQLGNDWAVQLERILFRIFDH